jgi:hypothetical protein
VEVGDAAQGHSTDAPLLGDGQLPAPVLCLPTCSSALTKERATWLQLLTRPEPGE